MATKAHSGETSPAQTRLPYEGSRRDRRASPLPVMFAIMSAVVALAALDGAEQLRAAGASAAALYAVAAAFLAVLVVALCAAFGRR
jgi:hypothetical protein